VADVVELDRVAFSRPNKSLTTTWLLSASLDLQAMAVVEDCIGVGAAASVAAPGACPLKAV
jgi:hypothetical protein